jgi:hypothetical protein
MGAEVETIRIEGSLLADLYARHADEALRLSYLLTGDGALAEDLVQDAFEELEDEERPADSRRMRPPTRKEQKEIEQLERAGADHDATVFF